MTKIAYIAGPFNSTDAKGRKSNIKKAEAVALKYWKLGYIVICPHLNSGSLYGKAPEHLFIEGYLELVKIADVIVMMAGWQQSPGAVDERLKAIECNKERIYEKE